MRSRSASLRLATLAVIVTLDVSGCTAGITNPGNELAAARLRWSGVGPSNYTIMISRRCECLEPGQGPVLVTVRDGVVQSRLYTRTGAPVSAEYAARFPSVDGLFAAIGTALRDGVQPIQVVYDPALGYATRVVLGDTSADGGATYTASDFRGR